MFRLLGDWLAEFVEIREQLNAQIISDLDVFRHITLQLEKEIEQTGGMSFLDRASPNNCCRPALSYHRKPCKVGTWFRRWTRRGTKKE